MSYRFALLLGSLMAAFALALPQAFALPQAYVTNEKDNTLSVIDMTTFDVVETIEVGERPRGFILSADYAGLPLLKFLNLREQEKLIRLFLPLIARHNSRIAYPLTPIIPYLW